MRHRSAFLFFCVLMLGSTTALAREVTFELPAATPKMFEIWEMTIRVSAPVATNPFDQVTITGYIRPQNGAVVVVHGFCDSADGTLFRMRFTPSRQVRHTYAITYQDPAGTVDTNGFFDVSWGRRSGGILLDRRFPGHFVEERTGRRWYHHGCTAQVMFLVSETSALRFIDRMSGYGFNRCRIFLSAGIRVGLTDRLINPFVGNDYTRFDVAFWQKAERLFEYMRTKNMVADINFESDWGDWTFSFAQRHAITDNEWRFFRYAIDRFSHYPNVTFNLGNEYNEFHSMTWANNMAARIEGYDPYQRLLTAHPNWNTFPSAGASWPDSIPLQAYSGGSAVTARTDWSAIKTAFDPYRGLGKPLINDEYGYEVPYPADLVRKSHWTSVFAGAYATYGSIESITAHANDDRLFSNQIADGQLRHILAFMTSTDWWLLKFDPAVVTSAQFIAFARAIRGHEYAVYLPEGGSVTVNVADAQGLSLPVEWIVPSTGERIPDAPTDGLSSINRTPPFAGDALLHVGGLTRNEPVLIDFSPGIEGKLFRRQGGLWRVAGGGLLYSSLTTSGLAQLVGKTYDDATIDFDLYIDDDAGKRAGIQLRRGNPFDGLTVSGVRVVFQGDGRVKILESVGDGTSVQLAEGTAPIWKVRELNRCTITIRANRVTAFANGSDRICSGGIRSAINLQPGYVAFFAGSVRAFFDNFRTRPIFHRNFDDGTMEGIVPISGVWRAATQRLIQTQPPGGGAGIATYPFQSLSFDFKMQIAGNAPAENAGAAFRVGSPTEPFGRSGYFLRYDNVSRVELLANDPVNGPVMLAAYDDPPEAPLFTPGALNAFKIIADGSHFTVLAAATDTPIIDVDDPEDRYPSGHCQFWTDRESTSIDDVNAKP